MKQKFKFKRGDFVKQWNPLEQGASKEFLQKNLYVVVDAHKSHVKAVGEDIIIYKLMNMSATESRGEVRTMSEDLLSRASVVIVEMGLEE